MESRRQVSLLFDDGCPLCTFQSRALTWLDWTEAIRLVPLSHPHSRAVAPALTPEQLHEAIHCVTPEGTIHRGARAIRHLGLRVPLLFPVGVVLWIPGVIWFAEKVYMWTSRNRHLLSRAFGCKEACSVLPPRERDHDLPSASSAPSADGQGG